jgi:hypothetical protein
MRDPVPISHTPHEMSDLASSLPLWPVGVVCCLLLWLPAEGSTAWCMLPCLRCVCVVLGPLPSLVVWDNKAHIICSTTCTFEGERRRALNHFIIYYMKSTLVEKNPSKPTEPSNFYRRIRLPCVSVIFTDGTGGSLRKLPV